MIKHVVKFFAWLLFFATCFGVFGEKVYIVMVAGFILYVRRINRDNVY